MDKLTFRQRRAMGLTLRSIYKVFKELDREDKSNAVLAVEVAGVLVGENPSAWKNDPGIDWENINWEAIFAFIEMVIVLITKFFL